MNEKVIFTFSGATREGYSIIGAGICDKSCKNDAEQAFSKTNEISFKIEDRNDPHLIDYLLYERVAKLSPHFVEALSLSIYVPNAYGPTGGIIGNPFINSCSADGEGEYIGNGLSVAAYPGGPGIIIEGSCELAANILHEVKAEQSDITSIQRLLGGIIKNKVNMGMIVTDGSGSKESGYIMTYDHGQIGLLKADRR